MVSVSRSGIECERWCPVRDTNKCKTMRAAEYMTPAQQETLLEKWGARDYVLRDEISAPDWANFVDRDGTAYSIEALAEEWPQGTDEFDAGVRELMVALSPQLTTKAIIDSVEERVEAGDLRAVVDSPDDWE